MARLIVLLALLVLPSALGAQITRLNWATFPVERERFAADETKATRYSNVGSFDGIGILHFSPEMNIIEFKGVRGIWLPYRWQEANDKYEFRMESFAIQGLTPLRGIDEYAFDAQPDFTEQKASGTIRVKMASSLEGSVVNFEMVVNTIGFATHYRLAKSTSATTMLKKYDEIFFGRNYAWFRPPVAR